MYVDFTRRLFRIGKCGVHGPGDVALVHPTAMDAEVNSSENDELELMSLMCLSPYHTVSLVLRQMTQIMRD